MKRESFKKNCALCKHFVVTITANLCLANHHIMLMNPEITVCDQFKGNDKENKGYINEV